MEIFEVILSFLFLCVAGFGLYHLVLNLRELSAAEIELRQSAVNFLDRASEFIDEQKKK